MSIEENAAPKRRSSAAKRRRSRKATAVQQGTASTAPTTATGVATADQREEAGGSGVADRHLQRREERKRAKQKQPERAGVGRVVNTERFSGFRKFYNDTGSEIRKVVWPDRETTRNLTIVVIALSVVMGILLGGIDYVLYQLFEAIG